MLHGRPYDCHFEYAIGIFDNIQLENTRHSWPKDPKQLMPAGRLVWNLLDPTEPADGYQDYWASYISQGHRLCLGTNKRGKGEKRADHLFQIQLQLSI